MAWPCGTCGKLTSKKKSTGMQKYFECENLPYKPFRLSLRLLYRGLIISSAADSICVPIGTHLKHYSVNWISWYYSIHFMNSRWIDHKFYCTMLNCLMTVVVFIHIKCVWIQSPSSNFDTKCFALRRIVLHSNGIRKTDTVEFCLIQPIVEFYIIVFHITVYLPNWILYSYVYIRI